MEVRHTSSLYEKLDQDLRQIRLLAIEPSLASDASIHCSLGTFSLDDDRDYFALSYAWGDSKVTEDIVVNGVVLSVTVNLGAALGELRDSTGEDSVDELRALPLLLWADAICINQNDIGEKNSQVRLMRDIYRRARSVVAWLGVEADDSARAIATIRAMSLEVTKLTPEEDRFDWLRRYPELTTDIALGAAWVAIDMLWGRDYWERTWVLQETVLAKEVLIMCGKQIVSWEDLTAVDSWAGSITPETLRPLFIAPREWRLLAGSKRFNAAPINRNNILRNVWRSPDVESELYGVGLMLLQVARELKAGDPRDKVYGLMGLTNVPIIPDYSKSVQEIYAEAASWFLQLHGLTRTLKLAGRSAENPRNLPSWVPDWATDPVSMPMQQESYDFDKDALKVPTFSIDPSNLSILRVVGQRFSHIQELSPGHPADVKFGDAVAMTWSLCKRYGGLQDQRPYITGIPPLQAVLRLVLGDVDVLNANSKLEIPGDNFFKLGAAFVGVMCTYSDNQEMDFDERWSANLPVLGLATDEDFATTFSQRFLGQSAPLGPWESAQKAIYANFPAYIKLVGALRTNLSKRRVFHTANGYLGVGPSTMELQDFLYILKDCYFPVILRRIGSQHVLIGICVIQGLMDGEAHQYLKDNATLQQLEIY